MDEPDEMEGCPVVEVELLEQEPIKRIKGKYFVRYWAKVRCLRIVPLAKIRFVFSELKPMPWPKDNSVIGIIKSTNFTYVYLMRQEVNDWFVITNAKPIRMILRCERFSSSQDGIQICNCDFDLKKWPHDTYDPIREPKSRRRRKKR